MGLARLLLKIDSFPRITELARKGDRRRVDLLVGDIYRDGQIPLPRELTAANFGKIESTLPEDLACALMGLLGENVALICIGLARQVQTRSVLYCGSTVSNNPPLQEILSTVSQAAGLVAHFPPDGAFCGAVGAAALAQG